MRARLNRALITAAAVTISLCGCGSRGGIGALPTGDMQTASSFVTHLSSSGGDSVIQHVVIIIQENRTMDNLFYGYPKADTQSYGYNEENQKIPLEPVGLQVLWDEPHDLGAFIKDCNGTGKLPGTDCRMNGFDWGGWSCGEKSSEPPCPNANPPYSYVPHQETKPYFAMAQQYVLADKMFASNLDLSSFVAHQYLVAAQADSTVNYPIGQWGCEGGTGDTIDTLSKERVVSKYGIPACLNYTTLGDELDKAKLSWRYYASVDNTSGGLWSAYQAVKHIYYGPDWKNDVINPQTKFFSDVKKGKLPVVTWITPTCANSDHSGCGAKTGPSWVASLVNAIGKSNYWDSTAIFVLWDDGGGWYDHVPPPYSKYNYDGFGMRVPLLVISAYAKQNYISSVQYEFGSILKFIEQRFGLPTMFANDKDANSPEEDCFDFSQSPRKFTPIPAEYNQGYFLRQPPDPRPVDTE